MTSLKNILHGIPVKQLIGDFDVQIKNLSFDTREISEQSLFIAIKGTALDGHYFINEAISKGASVVLCQTLPEQLHEEVTYVVVDDTAYSLGICAGNYYDNPSKKIKLVGVTGTNGKTTVATLLYQLFKELGYEVGLISTVENKIGDQIIPATHTTPDPIKLNALLHQMVQAGCDYAFMEVSSHAVAQKRIAGLRFVGGIFTNISHDHLDFHKTFDQYIKAKQTFFDELDKFAFALYNEDDKNGKIMVQNTFAFRKSYGIRSMADFKAKVVEMHFDGTLLKIDDQDVWVKLVGDFNAYNILTVYAAAILLEEETVKVLTALSKISGAEGRFDVQISNKGIVGVVDYAHTPDALENVLDTIQKLRQNDQKIITVVGCGGDRDKTKRPIMAQVALRLSDKVIFTSDNPRTEDPMQIIKDMEEGVVSQDRGKYLSISDRKEAINAAVQFANSGDIILIAGKGHEKYQEINGVKNDFDDKKILISAFNQ